MYCNRCGEAINTDERYFQECQASRDGNTRISQRILTNGVSEQPTTHQEARAQRVAAAAAAVEDSTAKTITGGLEVAKLVLSPAMLPHFKDLSIDPNTGTISASVNRDRIKCHACRIWFCDEAALRVHRRRFDVSCEVHRQCMAQHKAYIHAQKHEHVHCFVQKCKSKYRAQTNWPAEEIERHVWQMHYPRGKERY